MRTAARSPAPPDRASPRTAVALRSGSRRVPHPRTHRAHYRSLITDPDLVPEPVTDRITTAFQTGVQPGTVGGMRLLLLGGTGFVGRVAATEAVRRGWDVTVFNRGGGRPPDGVTALTGDRTA